jgi:hypothetical protein
MVKEIQENTPQPPDDPDFEDAMRAFAEVRRQYRNALKKLAG